MTAERPLRLAVLNTKGGTGKTTLALQLAAGLARRAPTVLGDLDPQGSATQWGELAGMAVLRGKAAWQLPVQTRYAVWDCPPSVNHTASRRALREADLVLVPVLPSPLDLWASWALVQAIQGEQQRRPALRAHWVINQLEPGSALSEAMRTALNEFGLPALQAVVRRRAVFRSAALQGTSVYAMGARAAGAVADIEAVIEEIQT